MINRYFNNTQQDGDLIFTVNKGGTPTEVMRITGADGYISTAGDVLQVDKEIATTERIGIGPTLTDVDNAVKLEIKDGANARQFVVLNTGEVGIGVETPTNTLEVDGTMTVTGQTTFGEVATYNDTTRVDTRFRGGIIMQSPVSTSAFRNRIYTSEDTNNPLVIRAGSTDAAAAEQIRFETGDSSPQVVGSVTKQGDWNFARRVNVNAPSNLWTASGFYSVDGIGQTYTNGSFEMSMTSNGYRNGSGTWTSYGVSGLTGASEISASPLGKIFFKADTNKPTGDNSSIDLQMIIEGTGAIVGRTFRHARLVRTLGATNTNISNIAVNSEGISTLNGIYILTVSKNNSGTAFGTRWIGIVATNTSTWTVLSTLTSAGGVTVTGDTAGNRFLASATSGGDYKITYTPLMAFGSVT